MDLLNIKQKINIKYNVSNIINYIIFLTNNSKIVIKIEYPLYIKTQNNIYIQKDTMQKLENANIENAKLN